MHLVCVFGPPAVGKMTVGRAICDLTGFKLFHNHMTVEPVLEIFEFGSPPFGRLVGEMRRRVVEEAVAADLPGLVFTYVWPLDDPGDARLVAALVEIVEDAGGTAHFVELAATFDVRRWRNATEHRLDHKRTHRNAELSEQILRDAEAQLLNTKVDEPVPEAAASVLDGRPYIRVDNTDLAPEQAAALVVRSLSLTST